ncbi:MipA/OmpV family protein [Aliiruegeria sabulilitoris]|uniref:MipA/OmpV family protein n=1 Tax=Aliiruegeria sabulilitoris TaxID=1510458 RepID=UPI0012E365EF|nr:MipA/OmpV family protein [Aliiruegeria sabulilitoris]NDR56037.1 MipA/OmpV family protein [Pseudoruegeria sp. M32A2M]
MKPFVTYAIAAIAALSLTNGAIAQDIAQADPADLASTELATTAQDTTPIALRIDPSKNVILRYDIRAGVQARPAYFGSDEMVAAPDFALHFDYARLKGLGAYGDPDGNSVPRALGIRGSLRFIGKRSADDFDELKGLEDIDPSLELGLGLVYRQRNFEAFGDVRYGAIGHNGFVGELGADAIVFPSERWEFRLGPRMVFGDDEFANTYFGVSDSESIDSGLASYNADGGLLGAGFEAKAKYRFNELWGLEASFRADRLLNSAADSPITEMGSEDQFRIRLGITRELVLQF